MQNQGALSVPEIDPVVVLLRGGRLPTWHQLSPDERKSFEQTHVDLMLSIARQYSMTRLEGFRLIGAHGDWQRFWLIEFPTVKGAEAWIQAEMAPPYGRFGHYEYHLSRSIEIGQMFEGWVTESPPPVVPMGGDPHTIPQLAIDSNSVVVLMFTRYRPGAESLTPEEKGESEHIALMQETARKHGLIRLEGFQLIHPQPAWHRVWVAEFSSLESAEAWIDAEESVPHGMYTQRIIHLARKWAPEYFASWC